MDDVKITKCPPDPRLESWNQADANTKSRRICGTLGDYVSRKVAREILGLQKGESILNEAPVTYKQRRFLIKNGIDPATIKTRKEAASKVWSVIKTDRIKRKQENEKRIRLQMIKDIIKKGK